VVLRCAQAQRWLSMGSLVMCPASSDRRTARVRARRPRRELGELGGATLTVDQAELEDAAGNPSIMRADGVVGSGASSKPGAM
jgi:hypothetical protein